MFKNLSTKLAILIFCTGPIFIIIGFFIPTFTKLLLSHFHIAFISQFAYILFIFAGLLIMVFTPIICMSLLLSWYILRPVKKMEMALKSLQSDNYKIKIEKIKINEFDVLINEINILAEKLNNEETLRKNLISDTSHELNTPVTAISTQLEGMIDDIIPFSKDTIRALYYQSEKLINIINGLQNYASIRSKSLRPIIQNIPLKKTLHEICLILNPQVLEQSIKIDNTVSDNASIATDKNIFTQIIINIINNAIKHSHCTTINITYVNNILTISDDGIGIPIDQKEFVFERFYRVNKSSDQKGLGLGLAITKELVESLGWTINLKQNTPNPGTSFEIII